VSLDSLDRDNYQRIRVNGDHAEVMRNVEYFGEYASRYKTSFSLAVCPMRQNWRELPALVRFCNERDYQIYFNTVVFPGDATLQYMTHRDLSEVIDVLENADIPVRTARARHNREQYRDLIRQTQAYRDWRAGLSVAPATSLADWSVCVGDDVPVPPAVARDQAEPIAVDKAGVTENVRIVSGAVPLRVNHRYALRFSARADAAQRMTVAAGLTYPYWNPRTFYLEFGLSSKWERFEVDFEPKRDEPDNQIYFEIGRTSSGVQVSDISLSIISTGASQPAVPVATVAF
jgi:hypothetical protein